MVEHEKRARELEQTEKGMVGMVGMRKWPKCTDVIAEEGDLDVLVGAKSDDEVEEEEEEEEEPRRQRQQQNELILSENRRKQPNPRKKLVRARQEEG